jgi:thiamine biosynthesis lipoprotein ApbE
MGGHATITIVGGTDELLHRAFALLDEYEALWSRFIYSSDVSGVNNAEGAPTLVDPFTVRLIEEMKRGSALTNGDFAPTPLPALVSACYSTSVVSPKRSTTLPASATVPGNLAGIRIDGETVTMPWGTTIDSAGIGKGLAANFVGQLALDAGAWGALVEASGDVVAVGLAPDRDGWRIGIENPLAPRFTHRHREPFEWCRRDVEPTQTQMGHKRWHAPSPHRPEHGRQCYMRHPDRHRRCCYRRTSGNAVKVWILACPKRFPCLATHRGRCRAAY